MVPYKGTRAGNLRQYIQTKPDKWGYKLFCRGGIDGFIHDILMYQGEHRPTFTYHPTQLTDYEKSVLLSSKTVIVLAKTVHKLENTTIFADSFISNIALVEYLRDHYKCRFVGTAKENRVGNPPITASHELNKNKLGGEHLITVQLMVSWLLLGKIIKL